MYLCSEIEVWCKVIVGCYFMFVEGRQVYVKWLYDNMSSSSVCVVWDWSDQVVQMVLMVYLMQDVDLRQVLLEIFLFDNNFIDGLYKDKGEWLFKGCVVNIQGYYCWVCGGLVGEIFEDVIGQGLKCEYYFDDVEYFFG